MLNHGLRFGIRHVAWDGVRSQGFHKRKPNKRMEPTPIMPVPVFPLDSGAAHAKRSPDRAAIYLTLQ